MRVACEYISESNKILVRLLGTPGDGFLIPPTYVQVGTYSVDFFPTHTKLAFDIEQEQITQNEAKIYLASVNPLPESIQVTLPDLTIQTVILETVRRPKQKILAEQNLETITPKESDTHYPAHADYKMDKMAPAEFPPFWFELNFTNADPLKTGKGITATAISYSGGGAGRILSSDVVQEAVNDAPYRKHGYTHLEGNFTNTLINSNFSTTFVPVGFIDPIPTGWTIQLADADGMIRTIINPEASQGMLLPTLRLIWSQRHGYQDFSLTPPITLTTPPVGASETLQLLFIPSPKNALGQVQLRSLNNIATTPYILLDAPKVISLNVGADNGPVKVVWNQPDGDNSHQILDIVAAQATLYPNIHTYVPTGISNVADVVTVSNISFPKWNFSQGFLRVDADPEELNQPFSWSLKFQGGSTLFKVSNGILTSDYSTLAVTLMSYLPSVLASNGGYKLRWNSALPFSIATKLEGEPEQIAALPFALDLPIPDNVLTQAVTFECKSFSPLAGSSRLKYFIFKPN